MHPTETTLHRYVHVTLSCQHYGHHSPLQHYEPFVSIRPVMLKMQLSNWTLTAQLPCTLPTQIHTHIATSYDLRPSPADVTGFLSIVEAPQKIEGTHGAEK